MIQLDTLRNRQWYHQRFDGSPLLLAMIGEAEIRIEPRKPADTEAKWRVCFFANGKADWYLDQADIDEGARVLVEQSATTPGLGKQLMAAWQADEAAFEEYFQSFDSSRLAAMSDAKLLDEFERYHHLTINRNSSSAIIDHFALGTDQLLADKIRTELGPFGAESEFTAAFSILTAPIHQSFITEAELAVLRVAARVQAGESIDSPQIQTELENIQSHYFWLANNYVTSTILPIDHFWTEVETWLASGRDLAKQIEDIQGTPKRNRERKTQLITKVSSELRRLLEISEDFTKWQDDRKRATYLSAHLAGEILGAMARRRQLDPALTRYLLPTDEVRLWFVDAALTPSDLAERRRGSAAIWEPGEQQVFVGAEVETLRQMILGDTSIDDVGDLRGLVASTGKAVGPARIVMSATEVDKVKQGDILVAVMTRPDYVPAMKRAAAIVTDEGGITSHAAIVSRELGVPCIIGTKIATKVFKDGDQLEVNANHNWVRRLSPRAGSPRSSNRGVEGTKPRTGDPDAGADL